MLTLKELMEPWGEKTLDEIRAAHGCERLGEPEREKCATCAKSLGPVEACAILGVNGVFCPACAEARLRELAGMWEAERDRLQMAPMIGILPADMKTVDLDIHIVSNWQARELDSTAQVLGNAVESFARWCAPVPWVFGVFSREMAAVVTAEAPSAKLVTDFTQDTPDYAAQLLYEVRIGSEQLSGSFPASSWLHSRKFHLEHFRGDVRTALCRVGVKAMGTKP